MVICLVICKGIELLHLMLLLGSFFTTINL